VQTTIVPPGGATIVEFKVDYRGKYVLVYRRRSHSR
jgi:nitrite reductase (NO-forming)